MKIELPSIVLRVQIELAKLLLFRTMHFHYCYFVSGYVAFVFGGNINKNVEIFSPNNGCRHSLSDVPTGRFSDQMLFSLNAKIVACDRNKICWRYNVSSNMWSQHSTTNANHIHQNGDFFIKHFAA